MISEQDRLDFEASWMHFTECTKPPVRLADGDYRSPAAQDAWKWWQRARNAPGRVYLVATGEVRNGMELYERHDEPVPLAECEVLYASAVHAAPQAVQAAVRLTDDEILKIFTEHSPGTDIGRELERAVWRKCGISVDAPAHPAEGAPSALLQLADLLESGRHLIEVERREAANALRLSATQLAAQGIPDGGTRGPWSVRKRFGDDGELLDCFVTAPDCQGLAYAAEILGDDEYRDGIKRKLADCELIATSVNARRAALAAKAKRGGA